MTTSTRAFVLRLDNHREKLMEASKGYKRIYRANLSRIGLVGTVLMLEGCNSAALLDPKGSVGVQGKGADYYCSVADADCRHPRDLMTIYFAYRYRESNTTEEYAPDWAHSTKIEIVVWTIPIIIIAILATITWRTTHELEPSKPLESDALSLWWSKWSLWTGSGCSSIRSKTLRRLTMLRSRKMYRWRLS